MHVTELITSETCSTNKSDFKQKKNNILPNGSFSVSFSEEIRRNIVMYYFYDCFSWFAKLATTPSPPKQKNSAIVDDKLQVYIPQWFHDEQGLNLCKV